MSNKPAPRRHCNAGFGWRPDVPDPRDHAYVAAPETLRRLPAQVDLRPQCPPVYTQGDLGSCTAQAVAAAVEMARRRAGQRPHFRPSRLFIYYNERLLEGTVASDAGAQLRTGIKSIAKMGVCPEPMWPYDPTAPATEEKPWPRGARAGKRPSADAYKQALECQAVEYQRVKRDLAVMKSCLAEGKPFVFGIAVHSSFSDSSDVARKIVPMPQRGEKVLGGHAVLCVGYVDRSQHFIVRNSWGARKQDKGYFFLPYAYLLDPNLSDDFWVVKMMEE